MVLDVWDPLLILTITWRITMNTQTILSATTCAQLTNIMAQLEELQALVISQYEGIAMQEQEQINKFEEHIITTPHQEDIADTTEYARDVCKYTKVLIKSVVKDYDNASQDELMEASDELLIVIDEATGLGMTNVVDYCAKLHSYLISIYEGVVMHQEA